MGPPTDRRPKPYTLAIAPSRPSRLVARPAVDGVAHANRSPTTRARSRPRGTRSAKPVRTTLGGIKLMISLLRFNWRCAFAIRWSAWGPARTTHGGIELVFCSFRLDWRCEIGQNPLAKWLSSCSPYLSKKQMPRSPRGVPEYHFRSILTLFFIFYLESHQISPFSKFREDPKFCFLTCALLTNECSTSVICVSGFAGCQASGLLQLGFILMSIKIMWYRNQIENPWFEH